VVVLSVQQDEGPVREPLAQVVGGADAGHAGADDEDVDVTGVPDSSLLGSDVGAGAVVVIGPASRARRVHVVWTSSH
jgi:hypothetical protein